MYASGRGSEGLVALGTNRDLLAVHVANRFDDLHLAMQQVYVPYFQCSDFSEPHSAVRCEVNERPELRTNLLSQHPDLFGRQEQHLFARSLSPFPPDGLDRIRGDHVVPDSAIEDRGQDPHDVSSRAELYLA